MPLLPPPELGFGDPPAEVQALLESLEETLDSELPAKRTEENVLIATWNMAEFGITGNSQTEASPSRGGA